MEKEFPITPIAVKYICDNCKEGEMIPTGENIYLTEPMQFKHKCNKCGEEIILHEKYPVIRYKSID